MNKNLSIFMAHVAAWLCLAAPVSAIDLHEITRLALEHDAQLKADMFAAEARNAEAWQSVAVYGPNLAVSGSYSSNRDSSLPDKGADQEDRRADFKEGEFTVGLTQPVIDLEKINQVRQGTSQMKEAELLRKKAREDLLLKVHERYYGLLSAQENLRLSRAESEALQLQVRNAETKLEVGYGTITDRYNAEARYRLAFAAEIAGERDFDNSLRALAELVGREIEGEIEDLPADLVLPTLPAEIEAWLHVAYRNNSDLTIDRIQAESALLQYRAVQGRFAPSLVFFADYSDRRSTDGLLGYGEERSEFDAGLRLQTTFLAGGRDTAAAVAAFRRARAAEERTEAAKRGVNRSVCSLWDSIDHTRQLIEANRLAAAANEQALNATLASYREGVKVLLDVLNAQQDYYRSLRQFKTSRYDYMVLLERFKLAVGVESLAEAPVIPREARLDERPSEDRQVRPYKPQESDA
jgi:outer membrane protein